MTTKNYTEKIKKLQYRRKKTMRNYYFSNKTIKRLDELSKLKGVTKTAILEFSIEEIYKKLMKEG